MIAIKKSWSRSTTIDKKKRDAGYFDAEVLCFPHEIRYLPKEKHMLVTSIGDIHCFDARERLIYQREIKGIILDCISLKNEDIFAISVTEDLVENESLTENELKLSIPSATSRSSSLGSLQFWNSKEGTLTFKIEIPWSVGVLMELPDGTILGYNDVGICIWNKKGDALHVLNLCPGPRFCLNSVTRVDNHSFILIDTYDACHYYEWKLEESLPSFVSRPHNGVSYSEERNAQGIRKTSYYEFKDLVKIKNGGTITFLDSKSKETRTLEEGDGFSIVDVRIVNNGSNERVFVVYGLSIGYHFDPGFEQCTEYLLVGFDPKTGEKMTIHTSKRPIYVHILGNNIISIFFDAKWGFYDRKTGRCKLLIPLPEDSTNSDINLIDILDERGRIESLCLSRGSTLHFYAYHDRFDALFFFLFLYIISIRNLKKKKNTIFRFFYYYY